MHQLLNHPAVTFLARMLVALLFVQDALFNKLMHADSSQALMASIGIPFTSTVLVFIVGLELLAALLLLLNLYTHIVAIMIALFCVCVSFLFHPFWQFDAFDLLQNQMNHFMKNMAIAGGSIYMACYEYRQKL